MARQRILVSELKHTSTKQLLKMVMKFERLSNKNKQVFPSWKVNEGEQ